MSSKRAVNPSNLRVYIRNLHPATNENSLMIYFSRWGKVEDIFIRKSAHNYKGGPHCLMAFITFSSYYGESPFSVYLHIINGASVPIYKCQVKDSKVFESVEISHTAMLTGALHDMPMTDLVKYLSSFGKVVNFIRKHDPNNPKKFQRFAFVKFTETSAVDRLEETKTHAVNGQSFDVRRVQDKE